MTYEICRGQDPREEHVLELYTGNYYFQLNKFLSNRDTLEMYHNTIIYLYSYNFYHYITGSNNRQMNLPFLHSVRTLPEVESHWDDLEWFQRMQHQFMIELYHIITRCPLPGFTSTVYRGVNKHYLKEDPSHAYHITTVLSTTLEIDVALDFSQNFIYVFTVMPDVSCLYYGGVEDELIINPYVFYAFIKSEVSQTYTTYHYLLFSSGVQPPDDFQSFMEFRNSITRPSNSLSGGSEIEIEPIRNTTKPLSVYRKTRRNNANRVYSLQRMKRVNNTRSAKNAVKTKKKNMTATMTSDLNRIHTRIRMTSPIGTSTKGVPLTREIKALLKQLI